MSVFENKFYDNHEKVIFHTLFGKKVIVAIHNTKRGFSLGGCRIRPYNSEQEALNDVLQLSKSMSFKSAIMDLPLGGGKAVIMSDPSEMDETHFLELGKFITSLQGEYVLAEDIGTSVKDIETIGQTTKYVAGTQEQGDPGIGTSYGVFRGIQACLEFKFGTPSLKNKLVTVEGLGSVGYRVCEYLHRHGAKLMVSDIQNWKAEKVRHDFGAEIVSSEEIIHIASDVFCPCALGNISVNKILAPIVAGSANNQTDIEGANLLKEKGILYAPDFVINSGGIVFIYYRMSGKDQLESLDEVARINPILLEIFERSKISGDNTQKIANNMALAKINK